MSPKHFFVYIMSSFSGALYVGVTSNLLQRVHRHKKRFFKGHTSRYNITRLVYWEPAPTAMSAINREKQIKAWSRVKKVRLIERKNRDWADLAEDWFGKSRRRLTTYPFPD